MERRADRSPLHSNDGPHCGMEGGGRARGGGVSVEVLLRAAPAEAVRESEAQPCRGTNATHVRRVSVSGELHLQFQFQLQFYDHLNSKTRGRTRDVSADAKPIKGTDSYTKSPASNCKFLWDAL